MLRYLFSLVFISLFSLGFSQNVSKVDFVIKNLGINVDGHFKDFSIIAEFSSDGDLKRITSKIKVASIETGIESRDQHILEEDYFNEEKHKYIRLESIAISKKTDTVYAVVANLSIKGITKKINIKINVTREKDSYKLTSNFEINRKDYKVGGGSFVMGKTVKISVVHYQNL